VASPDLVFQFWQLPDFGNFGDLFPPPPGLFSTFIANKGPSANRPLGDPGVTLG
jgi:hypothetical protein